MAARPKTQKTLEDLFYETLKDIHFAEKQILRALPKMAKAADSEDLRKAFETHRDETEGQIERLVQIFELIEKPARTKTCDAVLGIVEEGPGVNFQQVAQLSHSFVSSPAPVTRRIRGRRSSTEETARGCSTPSWRSFWPIRPSVCPSWCG